MAHSKIYVVAHADIPIGQAANCIAHGAMMAHDKWGHKYGEDFGTNYDEWFAHSFRKVTCVASEEKFQELKAAAKEADIDFIIVTESALQDKEIVLVFYPQEEWPDVFNSIRLLGSKAESEDVNHTVVDDAIANLSDAIKQTTLAASIAHNVAGGALADPDQEKVNRLLDKANELSGEVNITIMEAFRAQNAVKEKLKQHKIHGVPSGS